jgi:hypothetical protein
MIKQRAEINEIGSRQKKHTKNQWNKELVFKKIRLSNPCQTWLKWGRNRLKLIRLEMKKAR